MPVKYTDSMQLPYPCRQVFDLVADFERYPEFLPGWKQARILERQDNRLFAEQQLQTGPAVFHFHSTAQLQPCSGIHITSTDGPFREMHIDWCFTPRDETHCRVTVELALAMRPGLMNGALKVLLESGSSQLLPLFERRARLLYT
jgi:ribosome-associated toxin RatA of RatAB toxin-antitoxin module